MNRSELLSLFDASVPAGWVVTSTVHDNVGFLVGRVFPTPESVLVASVFLTPRIVDCHVAAVRYGDDTTICIYQSEEAARTCAGIWGAGDMPATKILRVGAKPKGNMVGYVVEVFSGGVPS